MLRVVGLAAIIAFATAVGWPSTAQAQVVRGVVVDEASGRPMPGIVVVLLDAAGKRLAGVLADDAGRYAIRIAAPGRYGVRTERIGYRADSVRQVRLGIGETVELQLATRPIPVALSAVRVTAKTACVAAAADGHDVSTVWEEARKALYATDLTQRQELFTARVSRFERTLDARDGKVTGYQAKESSGVTRNPFVSSPAAELSANGFVRHSGSETVYSAPDAGVLLSDEFLRDHCFKLRVAGGRRSAMIGLEFEPVRGREKPEIAGTLWLDRKTAELRDLEFAYRFLPNLPQSVKSEDFGGRVVFQRMTTGAWIVERWVIRMPLLVDKGALATRSDGLLPGLGAGRVERVQLAAIREEGGEVLESVARGQRREAMTETALVRGTVFDSTRMTPLPNARVFLDGTQFSARSAPDGSFAISQVPEGTYTLSVSHARFDSLQVRPPSASVVAQASQPTSIQLATPSTATIFARDCRPEDQARPTAVLRGYVRDAATGEPAIDARVSVTWNRLVPTSLRTAPVLEEQAGTRTDSAGRYAMCGLPQGVRLTLRAVAEERRSNPQPVTLPAREVSVLDVVVGTSTAVVVRDPATVASVRVPVAQPRNHVMQEFERRRRRGAGSFITRAQIEKSSASRLTDLLRTLPSVSVGQDDRGVTIVELRGSKRLRLEAPPAVRSDSGAPAPQPGAAGGAGQYAVKKCPASFLVDGMAMDGTGADIDLVPDAIEGIEVYVGGQVPMEYGTRHSACGVVIIWTRMFAERAGLPPGGDGER